MLSLETPAEAHPLPGLVDLAAAERAVGDLLVAMGRDPGDEHLADTPRRVAAAFAEMLTPRPFHPTTLPNDEGYDELVLARGIPFHSLCEHLCMSLRGVGARGARTITSAVHGRLRDDARSRAEFFALAGVDPRGAC
jgi:GTP cyclohydrolase IA